MSGDLRIGLVGYGFGGRYFHATIIAATPGCALAGVVTRSPERRAELAADQPGVPAYDSIDDLLAAGVDAVTVCTPAATHSDLTDQLLRHGVPVVCDKPFALDAAAARRSVELAEERGVLVTAYQNRRWDSDLLTVRRLIADGRLGEVRRFESAFERWSPDPAPPAAGGGLLRDFGSHLVDQALHLFGPVDRVYTETHEVGPEEEDEFLLLLAHRGGVRSELSGAWRQSAPRPRFRVSGTAATVVVTVPMDEGFEPAARARLHIGDEVEDVPSERGSWSEFYVAFAQAVRGGRTAPGRPVGGRRHGHGARRRPAKRRDREGHRRLTCRISLQWCARRRSHAQPEPRGRHWREIPQFRLPAGTTLTSMARSTLAAGSVGVVETRYLALPDPVPLDCGDELPAVQVAYETYGTLAPARDNVILVCHALSGDAHAAGIALTPPAESTRDGFAAEDRDGARNKGLGWWDGMIGPGKAFDTDCFFVVATNLLGGCRGTTGPSSPDPETGRPYGSDFPVITVADMVRTERAFLDALGIERLAAVAGGSLGGMQALEWAIAYPDQVDAIVPIASTHALAPQGLAWNAIAREAILRDPAWQGGHYYGTGRTPDAGMGVGRMVGHVTYLSAPALAEKFGRRLQASADIRYTITEPEFEVESYLRHQANSFVLRFDANTYLYTSRALTYFDLARSHGGGDLARALAPVTARTLLIAFSSDWLYPPTASQEIHETLTSGGKDSELHVIEAPYGHDCFLLEEARQTPIIRQFLEGSR